jgi:glycosyltransferase involved in cell wall biosynthesis
LLQTTVPVYRDAFIRHLLAESPASTVWAGDEYFDPSVRISSYAARHCGRLVNRFFLGRRLAWQQGAFSAARGPATVVLEMNPRILSNWLILTYRRFLRRRTIVWGHAWPRQGPDSKTLLLRMALLRLADAALVYTERDRRDLAARVGIPVFVAPNAVVAASDWAAADHGVPTNIVQIGRLIPSKKPALTLEAWLSVCGALDASAKLIFVGDGPTRASLEAMVQRHEHGDRVEFMGEVTDRRALNDIYANALMSISAGYAGLSLTDSLGYGVPMLRILPRSRSPQPRTANSSRRVTLPLSRGRSFASLSNASYGSLGGRRLQLKFAARTQSRLWCEDSSPRFGLARLSALRLYEDRPHPRVQTPRPPDTSSTARNAKYFSM